MPTYDYRCPNDHYHEIICSISGKPDTHDCPECGQPAKSVITKAPHTWKGLYVLDYPGSKALKAGYIHSHGDPGVKKVSSGFGGTLNPKSAPTHPLADIVQPERIPKLSE